MTGTRTRTQLTAPNWEISYQLFIRMVYHMWICINNWYPKITFWILVEQESLSEIKTGSSLKVFIKINLQNKSFRFLILNHRNWIEKWNLWCFYVNSSETKWHYIAVLETCVSICNFTDNSATEMNFLSISVLTW